MKTVAEPDNITMLSTLDPPRRAARAASFAWGRTLWLLSVLVFTLLCVALLEQPVRWLLAYVADDAFYYLQTARHIAATGRSTFDGLNPTNGYHPLWMLLMALCAKAFPGRVALLKACLGLECLFHLWGAFLLARVLRPHLGADWAWLGGAGWLLNPFPLGLAVNGVEAPLAVCGFLLVVYCWQTRIGPHLRAEGGGPLPAPDLLRLGGAVAVAIAARTDQALLLPLVILALMVGLRRRAAPPDRALLRAAALVLLAVGVCLLPWLVYSWHTVGTVRQDSGVMKMLWHHRLWQGRGIAPFAAAVATFLWKFWLGLPLAQLMGRGGLLPAPALLGVAALLAACAFTARRHSAAGSFAALSGGAGLCLGVSGLVYGLALSDYQRWHFAVPALLIYATLFGWLALAAQSRVAAGARTPAGLSLFGVLCVPLLLTGHALLPFYPWQQEVYDSQPRFDALVPAGARIGCLNAGIPAYFSDRPIVNLDGLVNHTAVAYWQRGEFDRYLRDQHIAYVADETKSTGRAVFFSRKPIPGQLIATAPLPGWNPPVRVLWRIDLARIAP